MEKIDKIIKENRKYFEILENYDKTHELPSQIKRIDIKMLEKRKSKIHGIGIFTNTPIKNGEVFYTIPRDRTYRKARKRCAKIGNIWIEDKKVLNWVNHSCNPNSKIDIKNASLIAIRDIKPDEEITVDYNKTETGGVKVKCNCKSEKCRGYFLKLE
jgi:SET domain-containing protein